MLRNVTGILALALAVPSLTIAQTGGADLTKLKNPAALTEKAPDTYKARFETTKGAFVITVNRAWAPLGADRFYNLVKNGFYDDCRFFRIIDGFMAQIGMHGDPSVQRAWTSARLQDDPVKESNKRGYVTFAHAGPNSRTTQFFINFGDNAASLDKQGFPPIGQVTTGMDVVDKLYSGYGEGAPRGQGPSQGNIASQGNTYLAKDFPKLDYVKKATIEK